MTNDQDKETSVPQTDRDTSRQTVIQSAPRRLTALTFDFWNTLYSADGGAMDKVRPLRLHTLRRLLATGGAHPSEDEMQQAYRDGFDVYVVAWQAGRHFGALEHINYFAERFGVDPAGLETEAVTQAVRDIEDASLSADLELIPGVAETVPALVERVLRKALAKDGLLDYFTVLTFSDETGYPKPDPRMFESTLAGLQATPAEAAHIGDIPRTDIGEECWHGYHQMRGRHGPY